MSDVKTWVIGHLGEALGSESDYAEPVEKEDPKEVSSTIPAFISRTMIAAAYRAGVITLIHDPFGNGTVAQVGKEWFYFGGYTAMQYSPEVYITSVPEDDIVNSIYVVLEEFSNGAPFAETYAYIKNYLCEHLPKEAKTMCNEQNSLQVVSDATLIQELIRRKTVIDNYAIHRFLEQSGYLAWKLWSEADIANILEEEGFSSSQENVDEVINTGMIKCLEDCTNQDWYVIKNAIRECEHNLEKAEVSDDE